MYISQGEIILRLLFATVIGLVFGLERELNRKPAGARTHVLVCLAACLIAMISAYGFAEHTRFYPSNVNINIDPARLVVGVLTGIGFIGAGIIWKSPSGGVQGLTTASEVFLLASLGIATGLGLYFLTAATALIAIITLLTDDLSQRVKKRRARKEAGCEPQPEICGEEQDSANV